MWLFIGLPCWIRLDQRSFLGATVTFSSTVVVMKLLDEKGATNRLYARVAIALF